MAEQDKDGKPVAAPAANPANAANPAAGASATNPKPAGSTDAQANSSKVDFTTKVHASTDASDANRDQNFDGTGQAGKDTLADGTARTTVATDAAAESSQLTVNELIGARAAGPAGLPTQTVEPGSVTVPEDSARAQATKFYRSSMPAFTFRYGRGQRASFSAYWLKTNNADVQFYIERQLMGNTSAQVQVTEGTEDDYNKDRNLYGIVQPVIEPLPDQGALDARQFRVGALQAKAPRTDHNPDVLEAETGNAQQDHFTQAYRVQTDDLNRPVVDDRVNSTEAQRAVQERNAVGGAPPATDSRANAPNPTAQRVGPQGSQGPSSAPRRP